MTISRRQQIDISATPYYHCVTRCVRRAFLCGEDTYSGINYDYRREWLVEKLKLLSGIFVIELCAFSIMSNHYHVVLHVDHPAAEALSDADVVERWRALFKGHVLVDRWQSGETLTEAELRGVGELIAEWRSRLSDISWFMRCLNEGIARRANEEDGCKGRFWEGRFKSQALLDDAGLLTCMAYVDLNPIRAGVAETPEASEFTSIYERIRQWREGEQSAAEHEQVETDQNPASTGEESLSEPLTDSIAAVLRPFVGSHREAHAAGIPFSFSDYIALVDWTGRAIREDKRGAIPAHLAPILVRIGIDEKQWLATVQQFESRFCWAAGCVERLRELGRNVGLSWLKGMGRDRRLGTAVS